MRRGLRTLLVAFALTSVVACARRDLVARGPCVSDRDCQRGSCVAGACVTPDASAPDATLDGGGGFCGGSGPFVIVGDSKGTDLCAGDVAQTTFRYALCSCSQLALSASLVVDAFDSREGPYTMGTGGASVGTNGGVATGSSASIAGSLFVGGNAGIMLAAGGGLATRGAVESAGPVKGPGTLQTLGDASIAGDVSLAALQVGGTLTQPSTASLTVSPGPLSTGATVNAPVSVAPPCDCDTPPLVDVAALVALQVDANDDTKLGITPAELSNVASDRTLELPCGRYYLDGITTATGSSANLVIRATGRVALFVAGTIDVMGALTIAVADGAEIDLFVASDVRITGPLVVGDPMRPAASRVYVGGSQSIALDVGASLAGNLYAPNATLASAGPLTVYGSVFAFNVQAAAAVDLHYDRAVLAVGEGCPPPAAGCTDCGDCGNQACIAGACGACRTSLDCCAPLACVGGFCSIVIE